MARINFLESTKRVIGRRAAYRCSYPDCDRLTVGPGTGDDDVENNGVVAHIHSAAEGGPRGQGGLSKDALRHARNGMWMCPTHSSAIDQLTGKRYPAETLQSWKSLHESRIAFQQSGRQATFGYVQELRIASSPLFAPDTAIKLAKATIIVGRNGSGKTALCEWLLALNSLRALQRWQRRETPLDYTIEFVAPITRRLRLQIPEAAPVVTLGDVDVPANPLPITVIFIADRGGYGPPDDLARFMEVLHLDGATVEALASFIGPESLLLTAAEWVDETSDEGESQRRLRCSLKDGRTVLFRGLSGGERSQVLLDFAVVYAVSTARFVPVLLMIEVHGLGLSWETFAPYMQMFASSNSTFQTVVTTWEKPGNVPKLGWQIYEIVEGRDPPREIRPYVEGVSAPS